MEYNLSVIMSETLNMCRTLLIPALFLAFSVTCFAQQARLEVTGVKTSVHGVPNATAEVLTTVNRGEIYHVLSVSKGWYLIQTPKYVGWIEAPQVRYLGRENEPYGTGPGLGRGSGANGQFDRYGSPPPEPDLTQYSSSVSWTEYRIPDQKLSFTFPKLPVIRNEGDSCSEIEGRTYHAYAGGVVYEFAWYAKSQASIPDWCDTKTKFSKAAFTKRLGELKEEAWKYEEFDTTVNGVRAKVLRATSTPGVQKLRWLIWDRDHWLEIGVTYRPYTEVDVWRLLAGLKRNSSAGKDLGIGADATLGDPAVDVKADGPGTAGMAVVIKPRPGYTDAARQANIQGTVILRLTFLENGGIGAVTEVKGLPYGLTEQAIKAARRIAFLPKTDEGKTISVARQIEYTFSIY